MSSDTDAEEFVVLWAYQNIFKSKRLKNRSCWVDPFVRKRQEEDLIGKFYRDLRASPAKFRNYTRMSCSTYDKLLKLICDKITKSDTNYRKSIPPNEKLLVTLRFLATGDKLRSMHYSYRLGSSTIGKFVPEVCEAIWEVLSPVYMPQPDTEKWLSTAEKFGQIWNFPNCLGAIDGKHIMIQRPSNCGSEYFNHKLFHSIVLQAVVDADGNFIAIDVGDYGRSGDSGVFSASNFGKAFLDGKLGIPLPRKITATNNFEFPFVLVADEAYPLRKNVMKPYARKSLTPEKRIFNYRLSRARRLVECAFGMITKNFEF